MKEVRCNASVRVTDADGAYWLYEYDELGQLTSGKRYCADGTPVAGQQFEYQFDDIGNRQVAKAGGDGSGAGLRESDYYVNSLNQYTSRTVPGAVDITGITHAQATNVTVNGQTPYRRGEYFWKELSLDNSSGPVYAAVTNIAIKDGASDTKTGNIFLSKATETFIHDADGNLVSDGRWTNKWDAENRLISMEGLSTVPTAARIKLSFTYGPPRAPREQDGLQLDRQRVVVRLPAQVRLRRMESRGGTRRQQELDSEERKVCRACRAGVLSFLSVLSVLSVVQFPAVLNALLRLISPPRCSNFRELPVLSG